MTARLIDGRAAALELRSRIADAVAPFRAATGRAPGLAVVLVGEHPPSAAYVRSKVKATVEAGMESFEHRLPAETSERELIDLVDRLNADASGRRDPRPIAAAGPCRRTGRADPRRPGQGRRRLPSGQCRAAVDRARRARALHAAGLPDAAPARARRPRRQGSGGRRPVEHRRQADGAIAAAGAIAR